MNLTLQDKMYVIKKLKEQGYNGSYLDFLRKLSDGGTMDEEKNQNPIQLKESPYFMKFGGRYFQAESNHPDGEYRVNGKEVSKYYFGGPVVINKKEKENYGKSTNLPIIEDGGEFNQENNSDNSYIIDFPELRQVFNYDCGVSALQSCLTYYGFDETEEGLMKKLSAKLTNIKEHGANISDIIRVAKEFKLDSEKIYNATPNVLRSFISKNTPVIVLLQAWRDSSSPENWKTDFSDGHYVVAIGFDNEKIIFEDPSSYKRTFLNDDELIERWHDIDDDNKTKIYGLCIPISGKPNYKSNDIEHMN